MKKMIMIVLGILLTTSMLLTGCKPKESEPVAVEEPPQAGTSWGAEPNEVVGDFSYSNDFVLETYYVEQAVMLNDMNAFVKRDMELELAVDSQVLGFMDVDYENNSGTYSIQLPRLPKGIFNDVDNNGQTNKGVQIFAVAYSPNLTGGPFSEGDDRSYGWPGYLASIVTDTENNQEVIGGKLVIWSPDTDQSFPSGFGEDGLLFTADDPVEAVPSGWSVIDLDQTPFEIVREEVVSATLYEPADIAIKDFSADTYVDAFQKMYDILKVEYAFNGIEGKAPDWEVLYDEVMPKVQAAQDAGEAEAYYLALRDFVWAFNDGHVYLSGGEIENEIFYSTISNGYGLAIRELDDGRVIVIYVLDDSPAEQAGIQLGATIQSWNGQPILDAIRSAEALSAPFSTEFSRVYQQARYLLRAPAGAEATVEFTNPGSSVAVARTMKTMAETESFSYTSIMKGFDYFALPVEQDIIESEYGTVGYVKITSNYDDLNLLVRLFERALKMFSDNGVNGLIIDMRQNSGGANLGLAGFLTDLEIPMGQLEYYSSTTGEFEAEGPREKVLPNVNQYRFDKMVLLVDQACASACELEAYGFSQVPGMEVMGVYPSGGVEAEVARGQFLLPENFYLQFPTGRFTLPDGSIFLEGQGVQLTVRIPVDEELALAQDDYVLQKAVNHILLPAGFGVIPDGNPVFLPAASVTSFVSSGSVENLEDLAVETYETMMPGNTYTYTVIMPKSQKAVWAWWWCTSSPELLVDNYQKLGFKFSLNGVDIPLSQMTEVALEGNGYYCKVYASALDQWPAGEYHLKTEATFKTPLNDGFGDYPAGTLTIEYAVYVGE